jgi:hypothetical protein
MRWLVALALGLVSSTAAADMVLVSSDVPEHRLMLVVGWDQTWVAGLGYGQELSSRPAGGQIELQGQLTVPVLNVPEFDAAKLGIGAQSLWFGGSGLGVAAGIETSWVVTDDPTGTKLGWLGGVSARPGYYAESGAVALDLAWQEGILTYMHHSSTVKELFRDRYPDGQEVRNVDLGPDDGWYRFTVRRLRLGVAGGYVFSAPFAAHALVGFDYSPEVEGIIANPSIGGMPFYAKLGGDYRW